MSYTVFGRTPTMARSASHTSVAKTLAELCRMERDGFADVSVRTPYAAAVPAAAFATAQQAEREKTCAACFRRLADEPC